MSNSHTVSVDGPVRNDAFGADSRKLTIVDRFGIWLSGHEIRRTIKNFNQLRVADIGCGYHATFTQSILDQVKSAVLADISISPRLKAHPKVRAFEGYLPEVLDKVESASQDLVMCISVLEHVWDPLASLKQLRRILAPGGTCLLSVPTWRGKWCLEMSAFRLKTSPAEEMDDHKMYYEFRDFWPLLVRAGFLPHQIRCYRYKFGIGLFGICQLT
ncbi:MAG TPA: class I SAM-dependent methyltransferase [Terriglobales bacterium]